MHPSAARVAEALRSLGVPGHVRELPEPAPTAASAAAQLGCDVGAIANSLVFRADDAPLLILTSGAHRVDTTAGHAHTVFPTSFAELIRITGGTPADIGAQPG